MAKDVSIEKKWNQNPEPEKNFLTISGQIILETELHGSDDAYLWESKNCQESWLSYSGPLMEIKE